jgi:hypothetical protein
VQIFFALFEEIISKSLDQLPVHISRISGIRPYWISGWAIWFPAGLGLSINLQNMNCDVFKMSFEEAEWIRVLTIVTLAKYIKRKIFAVFFFTTKFDFFL